MLVVTTDESDLESVARRALPESATDQEVTELVSAVHAANPGLNLDQIYPGMSIVVPTEAAGGGAAATPAPDATAAAVLAQLLSQIETEITSLGSNLPTSVSQEWIGQLNSLMGQQ
jgi:hypothetical protein